MTKDNFILPEKMVKSIIKHVDPKYIKITNRREYIPGYYQVDIEYDAEHIFEIVLQVWHSGTYYGMNKMVNAILDK